MVEWFEFMEMIEFGEIGYFRIVDDELDDLKIKIYNGQRIY